MNYSDSQPKNLLTIVINDTTNCEIKQPKLIIAVNMPNVVWTRISINTSSKSVSSLRVHFLIINVFQYPLH